MAGLAVASLVLSPLVALAPSAAAVTTDGEVFISEIHYDNTGTDVGEAIEVQAPVGADLTGWQVVLYNGSGGVTYGQTWDLGEVPESGVLFREYPTDGIQNGAPDGMALVDAEGVVVEFLSYEGTFTATNGPATGLTSTDIGVEQGGTTPIGHSLQRVDGEWIGPVPSSFGALNEPPDNGGEPGPEPGEVVPIAEIQGTGNRTPLDGETVTTRGVVTGVYPEGGFNGAFIQTEGTGADLEGHDASHGIFVFGGGTDLADDVEIGDFIEVTGTAGEYFDLTQIAAASHSVLDEDFDDVVPAQIPLPALEDREPFESMLIDPQGDFTVTDTYHTNRFGWVGLAAGDTPLVQPTDVVRPGPEADALFAENADREIRMDDGSSHDWTNFNFEDHETPVAYLDPADPVRVEAAVEFTGPVILDFRRTVANQDSTWNFQPQTRLTGANADDVQPITWEETRPAAAANVGGDVTLAAFNVLNYFTSLGVDEAGCSPFRDRDGQPTTANFCDVRGAFDADNLERQTEKIVTAINALGADVVALQEIENSISFVEGNQPADRDHALAALVEALNAEAGEGTWAHVASAPDFPADEDVIRNAFIYRTATVTPVGETEILLGSDAFSNAREPMAQEFAMLDETGAVVADADTFIAINNHFKSKGSGSGPGNEDIGDGQGASNADRVAQAEALVDFADEVAGDAGTDLVFLVGDFNSYTMEDPMMVFAEADYTNIAQTMTDKSTYSFGSMVGSLDHVLGSEAATAAVTGADIWNINAYESIAFEYSRYNYNVTNFHDDSAYRSSDHDPIVVGIDLGGDGEDPTTVDINLLGINDFHGRLFDYATDEDDNPVANDTLAFAGTIEELRAEEGEDNTIFLSSGDNIGASLFTSSVQEDRPTIEILNALDLATTNVGNHEFDGGFANLTGQVSEWADFEHLGANVYGPDGEPALPEYYTETIDGVTVAVIGVVTQETPTLVRPGGIEGLTFGNPVEAVNRVAGELTADGAADVIVASFHEGAPFGAGSTLEEQVASSSVFAGIVNDTSADVDVIFNGHTHEVYAWDGPVPGADGEFRPVIQGESYGEYVSQVVLTVDRETGDVESYTQRNVPVTDTSMADLLETFPRVAEVKVILDQALEVADELGSVVIGSVDADITTAHTLNDAGVPVRDDRTSESTLGNLVANALRDQLSEEHFGAAQIGVVNPGGLRAELLYGQDGTITFAEANAVLPFLNDLWTLTLTGEQFVTMLEQQWQPGTASNPFLHLGLSDNVSYTLDPEAAAGERITSVMIDGVPLDPAGEYRIGTFSFLAEGGDNFTVFRDATDVQQTGFIDRDAWMEYIEDNSPLSPDFARRSAVVVPVPSELMAGEDVTFDVSRLDLTSLGSPANTELAVYLTDGERGEAVHTTTVTDGAATVSFTVPAGLKGDYTLELVAAPSGTTVQLPVTVEAEDVPPPPTRYGFFLSDDWSGVAHHVFQYGRHSDEVLIGDWDGDGTDSITVRRENVFHVNNAPRGGPADSVFTYGRPGDVVLVGDWDGDGVDTLAIRRGNAFHIKNSLRGGEADVVIRYGRAEDDVVVGDWNGDGRDTLAIRRGNEYHVKNALRGGDADVVFRYGRADDVTLAGDWNGNGSDTFAIRRGREYHVRNSLTGGPADFALLFGHETDEVYVGDWNGDGKDTLGVRRTPQTVAAGS